MPSQEVLKLDIRAQVRAYLTAEMWGPCSKCLGFGQLVTHNLCGDNPPMSGGDCPDCQGSGKQFLLRKPCPESIPRQGRECEIPCSPDCEGECEGVGYVFNDSPDALWDAIRARRGTYYRVEGFDDGNAVLIYGTLHGLVDHDEGLRGQAAIELAVARALGWK